MTESAANNPSSEVATTGSDEAQSKPVLRYAPRTPRLKDEDLRKRERLMVRYMVHGCDHHTLAARVIRNGQPVSVGEALTLTEAARLCLIRNGHARWLATQPAFQRALSRETLAFREGAKARAWRRVDQLAHEPGDGSAAWAKVNHQAANTIIGEPKPGAGPTINVQTNVGVQVKAGLVLRLPADAPPIPLEREGERE